MANGERLVRCRIAGWEAFSHLLYLEDASLTSQVESASEDAVMFGTQWNTCTP